MARWRWIIVFSAISVGTLILDRTLIGSITSVTAAFAAFTFTFIDSHTTGTPKKKN